LRIWLNVRRGVNASGEISRRGGTGLRCPIGRNTYFAHGYSGHGVTGSHLFRRILSEAIDGDLSRFSQFEKLPWIPFPGGRMFRAQYSTIGSWWYQFKDAFGL
jgi:gamma-glutamylputrescine oxidase